MSGAQALIDLFTQCNVEHDVASTQGSIFSRVMTGDGKTAYPFFLTKPGRCQIAFGWTTRVKSLEPEETRRVWYNRFSEAVGGLSNGNLTGFPSFTLDKLSDTESLTKFERVAKDFIAECRK